jgi:hypothetical protein
MKRLNANPQTRPLLRERTVTAAWKFNGLEKNKFFMKTNC